MTYRGLETRELLLRADEVREDVERAREDEREEDVDVEVARREQLRQRFVLHFCQYGPHHDDEPYGDGCASCECHVSTINTPRQLTDGHALEAHGVEGMLDIRDKLSDDYTYDHT